MTDLFKSDLVKRITPFLEELQNLDLESRVDAINEIKLELHKWSPFKDEPVDCVIWQESKKIFANDYNPNSVAPPEMRLLEHSIIEDGYTQPIVAWQTENGFEVIDGFHRNRVGRESKKVCSRIHGYLPITIINDSRQDRNDRIASTIRHNRARGKHKVEAMSDIVIELKRRNWANDRICRELGMDEDEVLRLCQITGLADLFSDQEFSMSWDVEGAVTESDFQELSDDSSSYGPEAEDFRTVNTSDPNRIFHTFDKWECYKAGMYAKHFKGKSKKECEEAYRNFLSDLPKFEKALKSITTKWKHSCEHYLTNASMNRIAWLGQAAACYSEGLPNEYRSGFYLLTEEQQKQANELAHKYLNKWLKKNGLPEVSLNDALQTERQMEIY